jgi:hypothetical protein
VIRWENRILRIDRKELAKAADWDPDPDTLRPYI